MRHDEPCYFCISMSIALSVAMLFASFRLGRRAIGMVRG